MERSDVARLAKELTDGVMWIDNLSAMRAELRGFDSIDAPDGINAFAPSDLGNFQLVVAATIGTAGDQGGHLFYFSVVGADWFSRNVPGKGFRWGKGHLILDAWDADVVRRAISDLCQHTSGESWEEIARKLARYGDWEFEDYQPASDER